MNQISIDHPALEILNRLLDVPSPPGREEKMAATIREMVEEMGYSPETDPCGNVIVRLEGAEDLAPAMLAAHMDEIGLVVTGINDDGSLNVSRSGCISPNKLGERPVELVGDGDPVTGIVSFGSGHGGQKAAEKGVGWGDARILTGLTPEELKARGIRVGSSAVPAREGRGPVVFGDARDPMVAAWTFDDRAGITTLMRLLESIKGGKFTPRRPVFVAFTVHEEGGMHGAKVLCHRERPEIFIGVDGCPITPEAPLKLDGRPGAWSKDALTHYDQALLGDLRKAAVAAGTELQIAIYEQAKSDASAVYDCGAVPRVGFLGHVRDNSHGYEVLRLSVLDNAFRTLVKYVKTL